MRATGSIQGLYESGDVRWLIKPVVRDAERVQGSDGVRTVAAELVAQRSVRWSLVGRAVSVPVAQWIGQRLANPGLHDVAHDGGLPSIGKAPRVAHGDGRRRWAVGIGPDPICRRPPPVASFLTDTTEQEALSAKARRGFLLRTRRAKLRFVRGFIEAVEGHLSSLRAPQPPHAAALQMALALAA